MKKQTFVEQLIDYNLTLEIADDQKKAFATYLLEIIPDQANTPAWFGTLSPQIDGLFKDFLESMQVDHLENHPN